MKIIKEGIKTFTYECTQCGCIWECDSKEAQGSSYNGNLALNCPNCRFICHPKNTIRNLN